MTNFDLSTKLPYNEQLERIVLGSLILESTAINEVAEILSPDVFYFDNHKIIYSVIEEIHKEGGKIDMLIITQKLIKLSKINEIGGAFYITELVGLVSSTSNIAEHVKYLHDLYISRKLYLTCSEIANKAIDPAIDIDDTLNESIRSIESICQQTEYGENSESLASLIKKCISNYEKRKEMALNGVKVGITSGLENLDRVTSGFLPGQLIILAARPAMGKTAMMLHFAKSAASSGKKVLIFSLEMDGEPLTDRFILSESGIDSEKYRSGKLDATEENNMCNAGNNLYYLPIMIDKTANISLQQIKARARNRKMKDECDIILIDYLQLIDMRQQNRSYNREQEISQTSRAAKIMAKELGVPVILLSQLSRKVEDRTDKTPFLSDLRESGAIEQDADMVLFIHRPEYYDKEAEKGKGKLIIAKQREGRTGSIDFRYSSNLTRIEDYQKPF